MMDPLAVVRAVFSEIDVLTWALDTSGVILLSEGRGLRGLGYAPGQMVGINLLDVYRESPEGVALVRRALAGEAFTVVAEDKGRTVETRYAPMHDADGALIGTIGVARDVTEQLQAQRELAAQTASLREQAELLDLAHNAILVRKLDGTITLWNHGAERLYGVRKAEAIGRVSHTLLQTVFPAPLADIERELFARGFWEGELLHTRSDGQKVCVASRWVLRRGEDGADDAVLAINTDITERKQAEEEAARRQQEIIRAQAQAIEELSTPLIPITDEILVMPLIGMMDSIRAKQVMHTLLTGLASSRGKFAILDITGVPVVDTAVANAILQAAQAARLLGTEVILTGIRPEVAQTLVHIETKIAHIITCGTLQAGIQHALGRRRLGA
jgi:rsbT co-antagonist protein RsbR